MMNINKYLALAVGTVLALGSCAKEIEEERKVFDDQLPTFGLKKDLIDIRTADELSPEQKAYYEKVREYRKTDHVRGFGWYGNWTAKGSDPMKYLKMLPDSVDMVSLWGINGNLTEDQQADLKFFQEVKGGKAYYCFIIQDLGSGRLYPKDIEDINENGSIDLTDINHYWINVAGGGTQEGAVRAYANALCDSIEKYNIDGFDIDYEPGYGHSDRTGILASNNTIAETEAEAGGQRINKNMWIFIKTMYDRLNPKGRKILFDGEPYLLSPEASKMIEFYIYQAYWESSTQAVLNKVQAGSHLDRWEEKTIITVEFEQTWRTGGIQYYRSQKHPEWNGKGGAQLFDYATFDFPSGRRIAGIGTYHMEYDKLNDKPYYWLRQALDMGNKTYPGNFTVGNN